MDWVEKDGWVDDIDVDDVELLVSADIVGWGDKCSVDFGDSVGRHVVEMWLGDSTGKIEDEGFFQSRSLNASLVGFGAVPMITAASSSVLGILTAPPFLLFIAYFISIALAPQFAHGNMLPYITSQTFQLGEPRELA